LILTLLLIWRTPLYINYNISLMLFWDSYLIILIIITQKNILMLLWMHKLFLPGIIYKLDDQIQTIYKLLERHHINLIMIFRSIFRAALNNIQRDQVLPILRELIETLNPRTWFTHVFDHRRWKIAQPSSLFFFWDWTHLSPSPRYYILFVFIIELKFILFY
jgi:hypothetical protein